MGGIDLTPDPGANVNHMSTKHHAASLTKHLTRRRRRTSLATALRHRTWSIPLVIVTLFLLVYAVHPSESNPAHPFIFLSYKLHGDGADDDGQAAPPQYGKGPRDIAFVCFYTVLLTFTRDLFMQEILTPLARRLGIGSRAKRARFAENTYTALYIAVLAPWGAHIMRRTPVWYFDVRGMYVGFPHRTLDAGFKAYYLVQAAFWTQQVAVMLLGLEARRKDFRQLVGHHVVTVALVALSYRLHFTRVGLAVYITHDVSDLLLSLSKSLNYLGSRLQGWSFALCIVAWIYLRHYVNLRILRSTLPGGHFSTVGPYVLDWHAEQYKCPLTNLVTFALLAALQALNIFWLYCLLRSAYRFVVLGVAKDDRSEAEDEGEVDDGAPPTVRGDVDVPGQGAGGRLTSGRVARRSIRV